MSNVAPLTSMGQHVSCPSGPLIALVAVPMQSWCELHANSDLKCQGSEVSLRSKHSVKHRCIQEGQNCRHNKVKKLEEAIHKNRVNTTLLVIQAILRFHDLNLNFSNRSSLFALLFTQHYFLNHMHSVYGVSAVYLGMQPFLFCLQQPLAVAAQNGYCSEASSCAMLLLGLVCFCLCLGAVQHAPPIAVCSADPRQPQGQ